MKDLLGIMLITLLAYTLTAGGHLYSPDEEILFRTARALAHGEGLLIQPIDPSGFATVPANPPDAQGREYAQYGVGQPLAAVPLVWLGEALGHFGSPALWQRVYGPAAASLAAEGIEPGGAELAARHLVSWFNILLGPLIAGLVFLLCRGITRDRAAAWGAALLYALASLAWPHSRAFFTEPFATFWLLLAFYAAVRALPDLNGKWLLLAGVAGGCALQVRQDSIVAFPALSLLVLWPSLLRWRDARRSPLPAWLAFGVPMALGIALWMGLNALRFGGPLTMGHKDQPEGIAFTTPLLVGLYGLLFSIGKGLFFFSPGLVPGIFGWRNLAAYARERHMAIAACLGLLIVSLLCFQAKWQNWSGGWCWGPRHIFQIHAFLAVPVAAWLAANRGRVARMVTIAALLIGGSVQLFGSSQDFIDFHTRFFRSPGDPTAFWMQYDPYDQAYWNIDGNRGYFQIFFRATPGEDPRPIPLVAPAPIGNSLFLPSQSVWAGYSQMLRERSFDNLWVRLVRGY